MKYGSLGSGRWNEVVSASAGSSAAIKQRTEDKLSRHCFGHGDQQKMAYVSHPNPRDSGLRRESRARAFQLVLTWPQRELARDSHMVSRKYRQAPMWPGKY